jgi:hypothetical protein
MADKKTEEPAVSVANLDADIQTDVKTADLGPANSRGDAPAR